MERAIDKYLELLRAGNDELTPSEIAEQIAREYPFFTMPDASIVARNDLDEATRRRLMSRIALNAPDSSTLFRILDREGKKFSQFYPDNRPATPSTESALDTFLSTYGNASPLEESVLEQMIFNPVPDYASVLAQEQPADGAAATTEQDKMLDAFLDSQQGPRTAKADALPTKPQSVIEPDADSSLNESLANFFIKQGRYDKAYEIIHRLSLNFPEKSVYFADQLRFLQKLILVSKYKNKKQ